MSMDTIKQRDIIGIKMYKPTNENNISDVYPYKDTDDSKYFADMENISLLFSCNTRFLYEVSTKRDSDISQILYRNGDLVYRGDINIKRQMDLFDIETWAFLVNNGFNFKKYGHFLSAWASYNNLHEIYNIIGRNR